MKRSRSLGLLLGGALVLAASSAQAQVSGLALVALHGEVGAGLFVSSAQRTRLGYDSAVVQATGRLGLNMLDGFAFQFSVHNGFYLRSQGGDLGRTLALQAGVRAEPLVRRVVRLWVDVNPGVVLTGNDVVFGVDTALGVGFQAGSYFNLGPFARFHYVQPSATANQPFDALALTFGLSFSLRAPVPPPPPPPPPDRDRDGVLDREDQCPEEPAGAHPDPARRGCPRLDRDGDGVYDDEDQCPAVPQGAHPATGRPGCPVEDTDHDGVLDDADRCPAEPAGAHPDPERAGCPDGDRDHDGVFDHADACPEEDPGVHPDPARAGCPLPDRDHDAVPDATDHCPDQPGAPSADAARNGCPGLVHVERDMIHLRSPIFFAPNRDVILPRSLPILQAVLEVLRAEPGIRRLSIEGHTDDVGDDERNLDLSRRRAQSVQRWLLTQGIDAERLSSSGFGETRPVRPIAGLRRRALEEARAGNRRVDFRIVPVPATPAP